MAEEKHRPSDKIDQKLNLILVNQQKFEDALLGKLPVIPELEKQIRITMVLTKQIDRKVPDKPTT